MITLADIRDLKFRNKLLISFLIIFVPFILISKTLVYVQSQKLIEACIEKDLNQRATFLKDLIRTAAGIGIKDKLKTIAEKNVEIVDYFYSKYQSGLMDKHQAMQTIEDIVTSQTIGASGYIYCINSMGDVILHPDEQIRGKNISGLDFIHKLMRMKDGYLEYNWGKISKGDDTYPKAVFITYYKPLDWIICVSAYKDDFSHLVDISEINNYTTAFKFQKNGYAFIVDETGNAVMHPFLQGKNLLEQPEAFSRVVKKMINEKSGKIKTSGLSSPDSSLGEQLVIFRYLARYNWIIGVTGPVDGGATSLSRFYALVILDILFFLVMCVCLIYLLSRLLSKPIEKKGKYPDRRDDQCQEISAAQDTLKANELKRQVYFNQSFQLISILSPYGILEDVNESQLAFSQCAATDVLYRPYWDCPWCLHDETCRQDIKLAVDSATSGKAVRLVTTFIDGDKQIREVDISLKPVCNDKDVEFIVAESRDITEIKFVEKERRKLLIQLQKSQKMEAIGTLAGGIAHDFNNILSSIFGYSQLALMTTDSPEKLTYHLNQILKGAQRASDLVKQILTFSRQAGNEKSPLKLHLVVKEAVKLLRSSIPTTIEMVTRVETRDMVNADPSQMHQMIMNLCTNAYHAMMISGGTLTVSLTTVDHIAPEHQNKDYSLPGPFLKLVVEDTGHGMNKETIEKAFDPYFTTKGMGSGTGLGLALVRAIVEEHNGLSLIESIPEQGTSFFVYLPVVTKKDSSPESDTGIDMSVASGKETIMVVDDEPDILALIEELLTKFGYSVHTFSDGRSALDAYQDGHINFDLVITDMTMPKITGIALAKAILSENKNMPIILCSGFNETISKSEVKAIGVKAFLEKPLDTHQLLNTMRKLLDSV
ncbi:cache domain-containing protein [uncultured Desulfobacter sp.]|uniref:cache domain-containing protein n=1 Tax=uncultured Desulfobacter sp. TaxID=240139 RepID=UPI002AAC48F0|nr:cache domain-containing protein [uncultured Desulfobacter sp.]